VILALAALLALSQQAAAQPTALERAHAHNDYQHAHPLADALAHGFNSVEADVHLVDGKLLVAHHRDSVDATRTLESLYLAPLRAYVQRHGGRVHATRAPLLLLIDVKSDSEATYVALDATLRRYADILTIFANGAVVDGPIVAIVTGERAIGTMRGAPVRFAALDGRLPDLNDSTTASRALMPLVSDAWERVTKWKGDGPVPVGVRLDIERFANLAHRQGRRIRFWGAPDTEAVWRLLYDAGVDLINTDDLDGLRTLLLARSHGPG
jgi:glycerophosphoryl diester phosphodiesterase